MTQELSYIAKIVRHYYLLSTKANIDLLIAMNRENRTTLTLDYSEFSLDVVTEKNWRHSRDPQDCAVPCLTFVLCWTHQKRFTLKAVIFGPKRNLLEILVEQIQNNSPVWASFPPPLCCSTTAEYYDLVDLSLQSFIAYFLTVVFYSLLEVGQ